MRYIATLAIRSTLWNNEASCWRSLEDIFRKAEYVNTPTSMTHIEIKELVQVRTRDIVDEWNRQFQPGEEVTVLYDSVEQVARTLSGAWLRPDYWGGDPVVLVQRFHQPDLAPQVAAIVDVKTKRTVDVSAIAVPQETGANT
jgi:hypothetical protein